jgi:hypothetical protein
MSDAYGWQDFIRESELASKQVVVGVDEFGPMADVIILPRRRDVMEPRGPGSERLDAANRASTDRLVAQSEQPDGGTPGRAVPDTSS